MNSTTPAIACDLHALTDAERNREQILLQTFRSLLGNGTWSGSDVRFELPADAGTLSQLGEFLAYERRCCPFLRFQLAVDSADAATLTISGPEGTRAFIESTFTATSA